MAAFQRRAGSFLAARALRVVVTISQPASTVSRSLTRLEKHLGVLLAKRGPKGLILTDAGRDYLFAGRRALRILTDGEDFLEARRSDPSGTIKIASPLTMAREILAPLLKDFVVRLPFLRMEIEPYSFDWDQEPREDVDVFFKLKAPKDSLRRVRSYPGPAQGPTELPIGTIHAAHCRIPAVCILSGYGRTLPYRLGKDCRRSRQNPFPMPPDRLR
jgi:DNA-binding transcriptional LysR family regulator